MFSYKEYIKNNFMYILIFSYLIYFILDVFIISNISYLKFLLLLLIIVIFIFINKENEVKIFNKTTQYSKIFEIIDLKYTYILADYEITVILKKIYNYINGNYLEYTKLLENMNSFLKYYKNSLKKKKGINYSNNLDIMYQLRKEILNRMDSLIINIFNNEYIYKFNLFKIIIKKILDNNVSKIEGLIQFLWNKGIIDVSSNISNINHNDIYPNPINLESYSEHYTLN